MIPSIPEVREFTVPGEQLEQPGGASEESPNRQIDEESRDEDSPMRAAVPTEDSRQQEMPSPPKEGGLSEDV